jgi:hypothetical protein
VIKKKEKTFADAHFKKQEKLFQQKLLREMEVKQKKIQKGKMGLGIEGKAFKHNFNLEEIKENEEENEKTVDGDSLFRRKPPRDVTIRTISRSSKKRLTSTKHSKGNSFHLEADSLNVAGFHLDEEGKIRAKKISQSQSGKKPSKLETRQKRSNNNENALNLFTAGEGLSIQQIGQNSRFEESKELINMNAINGINGINGNYVNYIRKGKTGNKRDSINENEGLENYSITGTTLNGLIGRDTDGENHNRVNDERIRKKTKEMERLLQEDNNFIFNEHKVKTLWKKNLRDKEKKGVLNRMKKEGTDLQRYYHNNQRELANINLNYNPILHINPINPPNPINNGNTSNGHALNNNTNIVNNINRPPFLHNKPQINRFKF